LPRPYNCARGDDEKAARILGVSLGSAQLAKKAAFGLGAIIIYSPQNPTSGTCRFDLKINSVPLASQTHTVVMD